MEKASLATSFSGLTPLSPCEPAPYRTHAQNAQYIEPPLPSQGAFGGPMLPASAERRIFLDYRSRQQQRHSARRDARQSEENSNRRGAVGCLSPTPFLRTAGTGGVGVRTQIGVTLAS